MVGRDAAEGNQSPKPAWFLHEVAVEHSPELSEMEGLGQADSREDGCWP